MPTTDFIPADQKPAFSAIVLKWAEEALVRLTPANCRKQGTTWTVEDDRRLPVFDHIGPTINIELTRPSNMLARFKTVKAARRFVIRAARELLKEGTPAARRKFRAIANEK